VALIDGLMICLIRPWQINDSRPLALATRTNSTGYFARERTGVASPDCLRARRNRMCPAGIRMRVDVLWWPRIAA
jgi:hypothetical protein